MITLPDLPVGYRWNYTTDWDNDPILILERQGRWRWSRVSRTWVHTQIWGNEQKALSEAAKKLMVHVRATEGGHYGYYYPVAQQER